MMYEEYLKGENTFVMYKPFMILNFGVCELERKYYFSMLQTHQFFGVEGKSLLQMLFLDLRVMSFQKSEA